MGTCVISLCVCGVCMLELAVSLPSSAQKHTPALQLSRPSEPELTVVRGGRGQGLAGPLCSDDPVGGHSLKYSHGCAERLFAEALVREQLTHRPSTFPMASFSAAFQTVFCCVDLFSLMWYAAFLQVVLIHELGQCVSLIVLCS